MNKNVTFHWRFTTCVCWLQILCFSCHLLLTTCSKLRYNRLPWGAETYAISHAWLNIPEDYLFLKRVLISFMNGNDGSTSTFDGINAASFKSIAIFLVNIKNTKFLSYFVMFNYRCIRLVNGLKRIRKILNKKFKCKNWNLRKPFGRYTTFWEI